MLRRRRCQQILRTDLAEGKGKICVWLAGRTDLGQVNGFNPFNPFSKSVDSVFNDSLRNMN